MNYDIAFNKKTAGLILAGGILAGAVLFLSGYRVGLDRGALRAKAETEKPKGILQISIANHPPSSDANNAGESVPREPVVDSNPTSDSYAVQIGVFLAEDAAQQHQRKFGGRGYSAYVFPAKDTTGQTWYAVRIGHFKELGPATRTAVNFTMNERLPAHVRPANGL